MYVCVSVIYCMKLVLFFVVLLLSWYYTVYYYYYYYNYSHKGRVKCVIKDNEIHCRQCQRLNKLTVYSVLYHSKQGQGPKIQKSMAQKAKEAVENETKKQAEMEKKQAVERGEKKQTAKQAEAVSSNI